MSVDNDVNVFLAALRENSGRASNPYLRQKLNWNEGRYWKIQGILVERGEIIVGRGRGGSIRFPDSQIESLPDKVAAKPVDSTDQDDDFGSEKSLYKPICNSIKSKWINRFGFDNVQVDETHSQGSKNTGGTFTRPDVTAIGQKSYIYLARTIEVITFEIKTATALNIMGVLEAIAHQQAAHRAYVIYHVSRDQFDQAGESERIFELAQRNGIGLILAENPKDVETWDMPLEALRNQPDPSRLDRFLADHPVKTTQDAIQKWKS